MMENLRELYRAEAYELLAELERSLLALEEAPCDAELIGRVFRALHTIKGSGAMAGFDDIATFTHDIETVFDLVRNNQLCVSKTLIDQALQAGDVIRSMLDESDGEAQTCATKTADIANAFKQLIPKREALPVKAPQTPPAEREDQREEKIFRVSFRPDREIFSRGANPLLLLNELREMGECTVIAQYRTHSRPGGSRPRRMSPLVGRDPYNAARRKCHKRRFHLRRGCMRVGN